MNRWKMRTQQDRVACPHCEARRDEDEDACLWCRGEGEVCAEPWKEADLPLRRPPQRPRQSGPPDWFCEAPNC